MLASMPILLQQQMHSTTFIFCSQSGGESSSMPS